MMVNVGIICGFHVIFWRVIYVMSGIHICEPRKKNEKHSCFPLNPDCLMTGSLISWFMKKSLCNWVGCSSPFLNPKHSQGALCFIAPCGFGTQVSSCAWKYASKVMPGKEPVDAARAGLDFLKLREGRNQSIFTGKNKCIYIYIKYMILIKI